MGKKDTKAKEYLSDNERFADLCNVVLFDGEQVIRAESLEERDSTEVLSVLGADGREVSFQQRWRDLLKSALYDVLNYGSQVKEAAKRHRDAGNEGSGGEFLLGFHRDDRLTPVITITVYWGSDEWDVCTEIQTFGFPDTYKLLINPYYFTQML